MDAPKKYTYEDWWEGKICLIYSPLLIKEAEKEELPIRVSWEGIIETDISKIQEKQKEVFNDAVTNKLEEWKRIFIERHTNSSLPDLLLADLLNKFEGILLDPMPNVAYLKDQYFNLYFDYNSLSSIKNFIYETKVNGVPINFDFVHSPNYVHQNKEIIPEQVYAECCWLYIKWLELQQINPEAKEPNQEQIPAVNSPKSDSGKKIEEIQINPYPDIFTNVHGFNMFLELRTLTVKDQTIVADYGFIFHKMKAKPLQAILPNLPHQNFINFLKVNKYADLDVAKLPFRNPAYKQNIFSNLTQTYHARVLNTQSI